MPLKKVFFLKKKIQKHKRDKNIREYSAIFLAVSTIDTVFLSNSNK